MVRKVLHMMVIKWSKTSRNITMIKFGVILKILCCCYENVFLQPLHLSYIILINNSVIWWLVYLLH